MIERPQIKFPWSLPYRLEGEDEATYTRKIVACHGLFAGSLITFFLAIFAYFQIGPFSFGVELLFSAIMFLNGMHLLHRRGRWKIHIIITMLGVLIFPNVIGWIQGGFFNSGGRSIWSFLAPIVAILYFENRTVLRISIAFILFFLSGLLQIETIGESIPNEFQETLTTLNVSGLLLFALAVFYSIFQKVTRQEKVIAKQEVHEKTSQIKSEFLSTMSHEIRTPLNGVIGMIDQLIEENPREDQVEKLEILSFASDNLLSLVNDILDFSKLEAHAIQLEQISFSPKKLFQSILKSHAFTARKNSVELSCENNLPDHLYLIGDPTRLSQILHNLLSNAIKFSKQGKVILTLNYNFDQNLFLFEVIDNGIGISEEMQTAIWERFTQAQSDTTRQFGGTGLGLAIIKHLIELHGGKIELQSKENIGSTFSVQLPLPLGKEETPITDLHFPNCEGYKALIVDDNNINLKVAEKAISKLGFKTHCVLSGGLALEWLNTNKVDLVFMDLQMPNMDGFEVTQKIRSMPENPETPVVALTAEVFDDIELKLQMNGFNGYLRKPLNKKQLKETILKVLF